MISSANLFLRAGLTATTNLEETDIDAKLSRDRAGDAKFAPEETVEVTQQLFQDGLGQAGLELLEEGVKGLVNDVERLESFFSKLAVGME